MVLASAASDRHRVCHCRQATLDAAIDIIVRHWLMSTTHGVVNTAHVDCVDGAIDASFATLLRPARELHIRCKVLRADEWLELLEQNEDDSDFVVSLKVLNRRRLDPFNVKCLLSFILF